MFESHAGCLGPVEFKEFSLPYLRDIARRVKDQLKETGQDIPMVSAQTHTVFHIHIYSEMYTHTLGGAVYRYERECRYCVVP